MFADFFFVFVSSLTALFLLRKLAKKVGLVDQPNSRKLHSGAIPLVGGVALCVTIAQYFYYNPHLFPSSGLYVLCICTLTLVGVLDDKFDVHYRVRFLIQGGLSILVIVYAGLDLYTLGNLFGYGTVKLGMLGYIVTVLAVIGAINAFNMVDGIDGLLGILSIITFSSLSIILYNYERPSLAYAVFIIVIAIIPYIMFNLGAFGKRRKVFMGDAGSMLIGFTVVWFLLLASQTGAKSPLRPVTALWFIAVPLMDMTAIIIRRLKRGVSPFRPDREHLHHIFQKFGFNSVQTLILISAIAIVFSAIGIVGELSQVPEYIMFWLFMVTFVLYNFILAKLSSRDV